MDAFGASLCWISDGCYALKSARRSPSHYLRDAALLTFWYYFQSGMHVVRGRNTADTSGCPIPGRCLTFCNSQHLPSDIWVAIELEYSTDAGHASELRR